MPEAAVHEYCDASTCEDDVRARARSSRKLDAAILPEPKATGVKLRTQSDLVLSICSPNCPHVSGAPLVLRAGHRSALRRAFLSRHCIVPSYERATPARVSS